MQIRLIFTCFLASLCNSEVCFASSRKYRGKNTIVKTLKCAEVFAILRLRPQAISLPPYLKIIMFSEIGKF
jgi:hypothetical protein